MKKQLLLIGKKHDLQLDVSYNRINIHEMGYYITHKGKYVWSDNYYITKEDKKRFATKAKRMIKIYADRHFTLQRTRDAKLQRLTR